MYKTQPCLVKDEFRPASVKLTHKPPFGGDKQFCIIGMFIDCHCLWFDTDICTHFCLPGHKCKSRQETASLYELIDNPLKIRRKDDE